MAVLATMTALAQTPAGNLPGSNPISWGEVGAVAQQHYSGDGISITPTESGARLKAAFQKLEGEATTEGLWLVSTEEVESAVQDRFRLVAAAVGRAVEPMLPLPARGVVRSATDVVQFVRPHVVEEYRVSMDGVRQDFVIGKRPEGAGQLRLDLSLDGAAAEPTAYGARLRLDGSGRTIAYSRLHVTDSNGKEIKANIEVGSPTWLSVHVEDANANYPLRIDPTFSDDNWVSIGGFAGAQDDVYAAVVDDAGNLYVGGAFRGVGQVAANHVAKWDGSNWSPLGAGVDGRVYALTMHGDDLYVGGEFRYSGDQADGIYLGKIGRWNGREWAKLGVGMDGTVNVLTVFGTDLYAGGGFTQALNRSASGDLDRVSANRIAKWDGESWSALGDGMNAQVWAFAVSGTNLYVGGKFTEAGGQTANRIAKWDGNTWSALGEGMNRDVYALAFAGSALYAGGRFTEVDGLSARYIARWNGSTWSPLSSGMDNSVLALTLLGDELLAAGWFTTAGGVAVNRIARWDGTSWSPVGGGTDQVIEALAVHSGSIYVGGQFETAEGIVANRVAKWENDTWSAVGSGPAGPNDRVTAVLVSGKDVYVGGWFTMVGWNEVSHIAKWDGNEWSSLGTGVDQHVFSLAMMGDDLYVGGRFREAGGIPAKGIAKWDGRTWSALGSGLNEPFDNTVSVSALAVMGSDLYAGGYFSSAGGNSAKRIAKWDGSTWSALGSGANNGVDQQVESLAVVGDDLYVGGIFSRAGGIPANNIARWDGSSWSSLGSGVDNGVNALASLDGDLIAAGSFDNAGGVEARGIAKWDGTTWASVGDGIDSSVYSLAVSGTDLYAGGFFDTAGDSPAASVAKWDGSGWSPLGSGVSWVVKTLAVSGDQLLAGGDLFSAGGKVAPFLARAFLNEVPPLEAVDGRATIFFREDDGVQSGQMHRIERTTEFGAWEVLGTRYAGETGGIDFTDNEAPADKAFYRAVPVTEQ